MQTESHDDDVSELKLESQSLSSFPNIWWQRWLRAVWSWICVGLEGATSWEVLKAFITVVLASSLTACFQHSMKQADINLATEQARQATLVDFFDQTSSLLFEHDLRNSQPSDEARIMVRVRTLAALRELDEQRKSQLMKFLVEAELIGGKASIIKLSNADLSKVTLRGRNLQGAIISWANLDMADLRGSDFRGADLNSSKLRKADLRGAKLNRANLKQAVFEGADLRGAFLEGALLNEVSFAFANLKNAKLNSDALQTAYLCHTKLPDGTTGNQDCSKLKQRKSL